MNFTYPEDEQYFANLLCGGDLRKMKQEHRELFDFRDPKIKRDEFNSQRKKVLKELVARLGLICQLQIHRDCCEIKKFHVDHFIPLSSAYLQRKLRKMKNASNGTKPKALSYGSNNPKNFLLACQRCNAYKKHKIISDPRTSSPARITIVDDGNNP